MKHEPSRMKPLVLKKMLQFRKKIQRGEYALQLLELNYSTACNFSCEHCFSHFLSSSSRRLCIGDVKRIADEADELGGWQWHFQGGEPLVWGELDDLLHAIDTSRFHVMITSNGYLLDKERAQRLASLGVDKISVSLDSFTPDLHDSFRNQPGSYDKVFEALSNAKEAGLVTNVNTVITKQNLYGEDLQKIIRYAEENGHTLLFVVATSSGKWAGRTDMLIDEEGAKYIQQLKKQHPIIHRDLDPILGVEWGCRTMNGLVYVTPGGDLLSCPFIHISVGNLLDESLRTILERGWRVRYFRDYSSKCLAGEDRGFIAKFMTKTVGRNGLIPFHEAFTPEDLYES